MLKQSAILIMKIRFLKVRLRQTFKKRILAFPSPLAMEMPKAMEMGMLYKESLQELLVSNEPL